MRCSKGKKAQYLKININCQFFNLENDCLSEEHGYCTAGRRATFAKVAKSTTYYYSSRRATRKVSLLILYSLLLTVHNSNILSFILLSGSNVNFAPASRASRCTVFRALAITWCGFLSRRREEGNKQYSACWNDDTFTRLHRRTGYYPRSFDFRYIGARNSRVQVAYK